jgi:hypothetical protein
MGTVYKPTFTKPLPMGAEIVTAKGQPVARWKPDDGKLQTAPVTTGKAGELRIVVRSATYVAKYRDGAGYVRKVATGCRDESAARSVLRDLERRAELVNAGVMTTAQNAAADYQTLPLELHLGAYATHLESIGATAGYRVTTHSQIRRVTTDCGFLRLTDLDRQHVERWLLRIARPQQIDGETQPGASARTRNAYRASTGRWPTSRSTRPMKRTGKALQSPSEAI